jgi:immunomodulating metalloprotease
MLVARSQGKLKNGYHLVPRLHLLARAFAAATDSAETWEASRTRLDFASYDLDAAEKLTNNDFMLVAMSSVVELDYRDFFDMWGLETSQEARAEVTARAFPSVGRSFFALGPLGHNHGAMSGAPGFPELPIDGVTQWPALAK